MTSDQTFFRSPSPIRLGEIAPAIDAELSDASQAALEVDSVGPLESAEPGCLSFIDNPKYLKSLGDTAATAVICSRKNAASVPGSVAALIADQPYRAFALAAAMLYPSAMRPQPVHGSGISPGAAIHETSYIEPDVTIEHGAVIGAGAAIGSGSIVAPGAVIGSNVRIGRNCSVGANASVYCALIGNDVFLHAGVRIGNDGFGFSMGHLGHLKIPQIGRVVIQDNVEIGANCCIDRGSNRDTIIGEGTKIDDMVMVGHNVVIGRHCVIVSQTGIAGSAELGDFVVLGGRVAVNGHVKIGTGAQIAGLSGIADDVPPGVQWGGVPARPIRHWMREVGKLKREAAQMDAKRGKKKNG